MSSAPWNFPVHLKPHLGICVHKHVSSPLLIYTSCSFFLLLGIRFEFKIMFCREYGDRLNDSPEDILVNVSL